MDTESVLDLAADLKARGKPFALVTVVRCESPTSAKPGAKAIVDGNGVIHGWIGGGCAQPVVTRMAGRSIEDNQPRLIRITPEQDETEFGIEAFGMPCHSGGTLDIFIDPIVKKPVILVLGTSPMAQSLTSLASRVGFHVVAAFPGADEEVFPDAHEVRNHMEWSADVDDKPDFVVVATQGKRDEQGLEAALHSNSPSISFVASSRKWDKLRQILQGKGHDQSQIDRIIAPAGLDIAAVTPEEVALSVLAGLVKTRRTTSAAAAAAEISERQVSLDPICGMSVDPSAVEHFTEYGGETYYFCCIGCKQRFDEDPAANLLESEAPG